MRMREYVTPCGEYIRERVFSRPARDFGKNELFELIDEKVADVAERVVVVGEVESVPVLRLGESGGVRGRSSKPVPSTGVLVDEYESDERFERCASKDDVDDGGR